MSTNVDIIQARLVADSTLVGTLVSGSYTGLAQGGVHTRKIKRSGAGSTPEAFYVNDKGRMIRPNIVILDRGDIKHRQEAAIPSAYVQTIWVYFRAPATATGKEAIANMRRRVYELIDHRMSDWFFESEDGPLVFPELSSRFGTHDDETFREAVVDYQVYSLVSRYANII